MSLPSSILSESARKLARKSVGKTVIAHISDLHFTAQTNTSMNEWKALKNDFHSQRKKIDFVAVTGDLIDRSVWDTLTLGGVRAAFDKVLRFLISLCEEIDVDPSLALVVVPGNHDCRIKGVISRRAYFDDFYERFSQYYQPRVLPSLGCCIFTFDSNTIDPGINLASGRIVNDDIVEFSNSLSLMQENYSDFASYCKVVLVHHHPMPIAATELVPKFLESEQYHLLKNAGLFMTEMVKHKVDLILHGHKHYAALSKATFPVFGEEDHTISIIAAGSVSELGEPCSSYNLITIEDTGEIQLERKTRELATYGQPTWSTTLHSCDSTRQTRFLKLALKLQVQLNVEKYTRLVTIEDGSGDVLNTECFENVCSLGDEEVPFMQQRYSSASGWCSDPQLKSDHLQGTWEWEDDGSEGLGRMVFDPPIGNNSRVSFSIETETQNAFHFSKQYRLFISGDDSNESVKTRVRQSYNLFVVKISFPKSFFPLRIWPEVLNEAKQHDRAEERYVNTRMSIFFDDNTVLLTIEKPLPGYLYAIVWELPGTESEQLHLRKSDRNFAEAIAGRLLTLHSDTSRFNRVERELNSLRSIIDSGIAEIVIGADDMELCVHCLNKAGRLIPAVSVGAPPPRVPIRIGDTVIGQAFKRRESLVLLRTVDEQDPWDYDDGHTGVLSIPLLYPRYDGLRVGVITLATRSNVAPFLRLLDAESSVEDEAAFCALVEQVLEWYEHSLLPALDLRQTRRFAS